jgi:hypothetical protein
VTGPLSLSAPELLPFEHRYLDSTSCPASSSGAASRNRSSGTSATHQAIVYPDASHFLQEDVGDRIATAFKAFRQSS